MKVCITPHKNIYILLISLDKMIDAAAVVIAHWAHILVLAIAADEELEVVVVEEEEEEKLVVAYSS